MRSLGGGVNKFPEVIVLVHPEEPKMFAAVKENWNEYHRGGAAGVEPLVMPDLSKWPKGGGYPEITRLIATANLAEGTAIEYLQFDATNNRPKAVTDHHEDFASFSLAHLAAWMAAARKGSRALIVSNHKYLITNHMGPPQDFDAFVMSFILKGPREWDVLFLDKGERGVRDEELARPVVQFKNPAWAAPYVVYTSHMDSEAGANFYMVSQRFLSNFPQLLRDFRFTMVDGWLSVLCRDGHLKCFSYMQKDWYYGLRADHLEGHHPPDANEIPTTAMILANGGKAPKKQARAVAPVGKVLQGATVNPEPLLGANATKPARRGPNAKSVAQDAITMMDKEAEEAGVKIEMTKEEAELAAKGVAMKPESKEEKEAAAAAVGGDEEAAMQQVADDLKQERDAAREDAAKVGLDSPPKLTAKRKAEKRTASRRKNVAS